MVTNKEEDQFSIPFLTLPKEILTSVLDGAANDPREVETVL